MTVNLGRKMTSSEIAKLKIKSGTPITTKGGSDEKLVKMDATYRVKLYRPSKDAPVVRIRYISSFDQAEIISEEPLSGNVQTLAQLKESGDAKAALEAMPESEIPNFASELEAMMFAHKIFSEADQAKVKAFMIRMLSPYYFEEGSDVILNNSGVKKVNSVLEVLFGGSGTYMDQYCENPKVKTQQQTMIELWNRAKDRYTRFTAGKFNGKIQTQGCCRLPACQAGGDCTREGRRRGQLRQSCAGRGTCTGKCQSIESGFTCTGKKENGFILVSGLP